jgi:hypothetical protein
MEKGWLIRHTPLTIMIAYSSLVGHDAAQHTRQLLDHFGIYGMY